VVLPGRRDRLRHAPVVPVGRQHRAPEAPRDQVLQAAVIDPEVKFPRRALGGSSYSAGFRSAKIRAALESASA